METNDTNDTNARVAMLMQGMEAFGRGDSDYMKGTMSPDIVWHLPGNHSMSGDYRGPDEVVEMLGELLRRTQGRVEPVDLLVGDDFVMSFTKFTGPDGLELTFADAFRFGEDDLITEYWSLGNDQEAYDALVG